MARRDLSQRLTNGSRVAVIGGGPAGSFFAHWALRLAANQGIALDLTVFERKNFSHRGPAGCNMCAGVLSTRLLRSLSLLQLAVPESLVLGRIRSYIAHWSADHFEIFPPESGGEIISIYRGGGPRRGDGASAGFDGYLLQEARDRGARVVREQVQAVSFVGERPEVQTGSGAAPYDLVVLAGGVNSPSPVLRNVSYTPPSTEVMVQDEIRWPQEPGRATQDGSVHVYFEKPAGLLFGGIIPKGNYANVSLLGKGLGSDSVAQFLRTEEVSTLVREEPQRLCGCFPRIAVLPARGYFADRFVSIGDACVSRLYKDGIGSAFVTARAAAETAFHFGVGRKAFAAGFAPVCRAIARDNQIGRLVFGVLSRGTSNEFMKRVWCRAFAAEQRRPRESRPLSRALWGLFTGDTSYRQIFGQMIRLPCMFGVGSAMLREIPSSWTDI